MPNDTLHASTQALACIAASLGRIAQRYDLPRHYEDEHVQHPPRDVGVECVEIACNGPT